MVQKIVFDEMFPKSLGDLRAWSKNALFLEGSGGAPRGGYLYRGRAGCGSGPPVARLVGPRLTATPGLARVTK